MDDAAFEQFLGKLLRVGVFAAAMVVSIGGVVYLTRHANEAVNYSTFKPDGLPELRTPRGIIASALTFSGRGIIQLGLLLLIATPVARVVISVIGFARQRDFTYVVLTLIVLVVLLYSLFFEGP
jgi:uncharacterized membrane protein